MGMKLILLSIFVVVGMMGAAAHAAGGDSDASTQLQNLVYYPHAGHLRFIGQFVGSVQDSGSTDNDLGVETTLRSTTYERASANLAYGIVNGLRASVADTYLFDQQSEATAMPKNTTSTSDSHGFSDPTISVSERFIDAEEGFSADASASFVPGLGRALAAGNGQSGNDLSSAWNATASLPMYYRLPVFGFSDEVEVNPSVTRSFGGVTSGSTSKTSTLTSSYWSGAVAFTDRFHINSSWFIQPGVTVNIPYSYRNVNQTAGAVDTYQTVDLYASPTLNIGYLPRDWIMIDATLTYTDQGASAYPATGSSTSSQTAQTYVGLQVQLAF